MVEAPASIDRRPRWQPERPMQSRPAAIPDKLRALIFLSTGVALFAVLDGLGKLLAADHSVAQVVWARYAFAMPVVMLVARPPAWRAAAAAPQKLWQVLRAFLPLGASMLVVLGVTRMPLGDFTAISYASPLLVVALSWPMLGERTGAATWIGVVAGFLGVIVIAQPGADAVALTALFPLGTAFSFALYQVMTRWLSRGSEPTVTFIWTISVGLVISSVALPVGWRPVASGSWPVLAASGLLFGVAHLLVIRAYALAPAAFLAPFTYVQIVAAAIMGFVVFGDIPSISTTIGALIIVASGIVVLSQRSRLSATAGLPKTIRALDPSDRSP
jgi:drug/metabolite transporter (DMT)-like permease